MVYLKDRMGLMHVRPSSGLAVSTGLIISTGVTTDFHGLGNAVFSGRHRHARNVFSIALFMELCS